LDSFAGFTQMGMVPAAGDARLSACAMSGRTPALAWQLAGSGVAMAAKQTATIYFVDTPDTNHRHRRPWGTS